MIRAIALLAALEAARHGAYRASFHGFRVEALRQSSGQDGAALVQVNLRVTLGANLLERSLVQVPQHAGAGLRRGGDPGGRGTEPKR
jgi:phage head maturation protease